MSNRSCTRSPRHLSIVSDEIQKLEVTQLHDEKVHPTRESLPRDLRTWRLEVVQSLLSAGVPLSKIDRLRPLLEKNNFRLTSSQNMSQLAPLILDHELQQLKEELSSGVDKDSALILTEAQGRARQWQLLLATSVTIEAEVGENRHPR